MRLTPLRYLPRPRTFHLQWHLTERCNLKCKHCYQDEDYIKSELNKEQLFEIFYQYLELTKKWRLGKDKSVVSLTGGEPLLHKDFFALLKLCCEHKDFLTCNILTNGTLFDKKLVQKLKDLPLTGLVQVSLEGMEKTNDFIRGKGTFKKIVSCLKLLVSKGFRTRIAVTISKYNSSDIPEIISLGERLGVDFIMFERLVPHGRGQVLKNQMLEPTELKDLLTYIAKRHEELDKKNSKPELMNHCSSLLFPNCSSAYNSLTILPNGDVVPCRKLPIKVGTLPEQSLFEIWYASNTLWHIRDKSNLNSICKTCSRFNSCYGGSRCVANAYFGDISAPDPQCWYSFKDLPADFDASGTKEKTSPILLDRYIIMSSSSRKLAPYILKSCGKTYLRTEEKDYELKDDYYLEVNLSKTDLSKLSNKLLLQKPELLLISFLFGEKDMNLETGRKLEKFFHKLKENNLNFQVTRPVPRCFFGFNYSSIAEKYKIPTSCESCLELFKVDEKGNILFCKQVDKKGPDIRYMNDRKQIHEFFESFKENTCPVQCIYKVRNQCEGVCPLSLIPDAI